MWRKVTVLAVLLVLFGAMTSCGLATAVVDLVSLSVPAAPASASDAAAAGELAASTTTEPTTGGASASGVVTPLAVAPATAPSTSAPAVSSASDPSPDAATVAEDLLRLVNDERSKHGLEALVRDADLDALAQAYAGSGLDDAVLDQSDLRFLLTNSWWITFRGGPPRFDADTAPEQLAYCLGEERMREAMLRPEARRTGLGVAVVGDSIYYTQAFDVVATLGGDGGAVELQENPAAKDPSWEALLAFLASDPTDSQTYSVGSYVCADFAETLHNNAEQAGIRAAYVAVELAEGPGHALNAFIVSGREVYVDAIGGDKIACVEAGRPFGVMSLEAASRYQCDGFDAYAASVRDYIAQGEAYSGAVGKYNSELEQYNAAVRAHNRNPSDAEFDRLTAWSQALEGQAADLDSWDAKLRALAEELGISETYWEPVGSLVGAGDAPIVGIYVHW